MEGKTVHLGKEGRPLWYGVRRDRLPPALDRMIVALCGDYDRRAALLRTADAPPEVLESCASLNSAIDGAVAEVCEDGIRRQMLLDIVEGRGARRTPLYFLGEGTYKRRKRDVKLSIARRLKLM